jgi:hypothetical protein
MIPVFVDEAELPDSDSLPLSVQGLFAFESYRISTRDWIRPPFAPTSERQTTLRISLIP